MPSSQISISTGSILAAMTVLLALAQICSAQTYHFSNGWYGGKKRSSLPSSSSSSTPAILGLMPNFGATTHNAGSSVGSGNSGSGSGIRAGSGSSSSRTGNNMGLLNFDLGGGDWRQMDSTACGARLQTLAAIQRLLQDEAIRIQKSCTASLPSGLRELLLQGSSSKW